MTLLPGPSSESLDGGRWAWEPLSPCFHPPAPPQSASFLFLLLPHPLPFLKFPEGRLVRGTGEDRGSLGGGCERLGPGLQVEPRRPKRAAAGTAQGCSRRRWRRGLGRRPTEGRSVRRRDRRAARPGAREAAAAPFPALSLPGVRLVQRIDAGGSGQESFPFFLAKGKRFVCSRARARVCVGGLRLAVRTDLFPGPPKGVPCLQTNFTFSASAGIKCAFRPGATKGRGAGTRRVSPSLHFHFTSPSSNSFCSFFLIGKKK